MISSNITNNNAHSMTDFQGHHQYYRTTIPIATRLKQSSRARWTALLLLATVGYLARHMQMPFRGITRRQHLNPQDPSKKAAPKRELDFVIAGFPKTGTTTLLYALHDHKEVGIALSERCGSAQPHASDARAQQQLNAAVQEIATTAAPNVNIGIKCPTMISNYNAVSSLQSHSPNAKLIVGLRHPVELLQSFYNYRVTETYDRFPNQKIPSFLEIASTGSSWNGFSLDSIRYDLFLMQLGKVSMSVHDMHRIGTHRTLGVRPSDTQVFLYTLDQVEDTNRKRSHTFRSSLQHFLALKKPIKPFTHENTNHFVGKQAYPETLDICEHKFDRLRSKLVDQGKQTAKWIKKLLRNPDVYVGNREQFLRSIEKWGTDPCSASQVALKKHHRTLRNPLVSEM